MKTAVQSYPFLELSTTFDLTADMATFPVFNEDKEMVPKSDDERTVERMIPYVQDERKEFTD